MILPGSVSWDLLALLDRDGVTDRFGDLGGSLVDLGWGHVGADEGGDVPGLGLCVRLGLPLAVVVGGRSHHGLRHAKTGVVRSSVGNSDGRSGSNSGGHHLAVVTHHLLGDDGLGGGLLAGGGDDLLAVLGVDSVHDLVVLLVTDLAGGLHLPGAALQLGDGVTLGAGHGHGLVTAEHLRVGLGVSLGLSLDGRCGETQTEEE